MFILISSKICERNLASNGASRDDMQSVAIPSLFYRICYDFPSIAFMNNLTDDGVKVFSPSRRHFCLDLLLVFTVNRLVLDHNLK